MKQTAKIYAAWVAALGSVAFGSAISQWRFSHADWFPVWFLGAVIGATLKLRIPGTGYTFSAGSLFLLIAAAEMEYTQVLLMTCAVAAAQTLLNVRKRPSPSQLLFNIAANALSMGLTWLICHGVLGPWLDGNAPAQIVVAACVFFPVTTVLASGVVALSDVRPLLRTWDLWLRGAAPYFITGAALAVAAEEAGRRANWMMMLAALPSVALASLTFRAQVALTEKGLLLNGSGRFLPPAHP